MAAGYWMFGNMLTDTKKQELLQLLPQIREFIKNREKLNEIPDNPGSPKPFNLPQDKSPLQQSSPNLAEDETEPAQPLPLDKRKPAFSPVPANQEARRENVAQAAPLKPFLVYAVDHAKLENDRLIMRITINDPYRVMEAARDIIEKDEAKHDAVKMVFFCPETEQSKTTPISVVNWTTADEFSVE